MRKTFTLAFVSALLIFTTAFMVAAGTSSPLASSSATYEWWHGEYATGDWFGLRTTLADHGITPSLGYSGNFAANPVGGHSQGAAHSASFHLAYAIDFAKLFKNDALNGLTLGNTWVWRFGDSLTHERLGNAFTVQQNYGNQTIRMQSLFLQYYTDVSWGQLRFKAGRFAAGDEFMTHYYNWLYQNNAIDGNPVGVFYQTRWSAYPAGAWAALLETRTHDGKYVRAGVYQLNTDAQDSEKRHGLDWSFRGLGVNLNVEAGWDINHDDSGKAPSSFSFGLVSDWYNAPRLDDPDATRRYNCTLYAQGDCMLYNQGLPTNFDSRKNSDDAYKYLRGLSLWGVVQYAPREDLAKMPLFLNGGLFYRGLLPQRESDLLCFGLAYGHFSRKLTDDRRNRFETMLELNYKYQLTRFASIQPNVQYIIKPSGGQAPNALVLGVQYAVTF